MTDADPFVVAASLSGVADAAWARGAAPYVDCALMGGIALDPASRAAARDLVERGRSEFLPADPVGWIDEQFRALADTPVRPGVNVRSATAEPVREAAAVCAAHGAVCELNAHCRQPEVCAVGCGETLLADTDRLAEYVAAATGAGATTSVKIRAAVAGVDLPEVARAVAGAGADWLHVDAMDSEPAIAEVVDGLTTDGTAGDVTVVANNGVRGRESVAEYAEYGADAVSVGRPSDDPQTLARIAEAVDAWRDRDEDGRIAPSGGERVEPEASG
ncbi:MAG: tRNA-dihydrouridine synthase [Halorubrum sp.]